MFRIQTWRIWQPQLYWITKQKYRICTIDNCRGRICEFDEPETWEYTVHEQKFCVSEPNIMTRINNTVWITKQQYWSCAIDGCRCRICEFGLWLKTEWWMANMLKILMMNCKIDKQKTWNWNMNSSQPLDWTTCRLMCPEFRICLHVYMLQMWSWNWI